MSNENGSSAEKPHKAGAFDIRTFIGYNTDFADLCFVLGVLAFNFQPA